MSGKIITQQGDPVEAADEKVEEPSPAEDLRAIAEDINEGLNEGLKGLRRFRNSIILKVGAVAVALKVIDVVGKIVMENQRLKAKPRQDDEQ